MKVANFQLKLLKKHIAVIISVSENRIYSLKCKKNPK